MLGVSATELDYPSAAKVYFQNAIRESSKVLRGKCIGSYCMGVDLPAAATAALNDLPT